MPVPAFVESPRFPEDISNGAKGGPAFKTDVFISQSGFEQRNMLWQDARCVYDVSHGIRDKLDMDEVLAFFYAMRGKATAFRFKDWSDYQLAAENIGDGDGVTTAFQITKTYVSGGNEYVRLIKKIVAASVSGVTVNAVAKVETADFTVDYATGIITFNVAPGSGHDIVIGALEFDVAVRFDTDNMAITLEAWQLESWDSISLVEVRI